MIINRVLARKTKLITKISSGQNVWIRKRFRILDEQISKNWSLHEKIEVKQIWLISKRENGGVVKFAQESSRPQKRNKKRRSQSWFPKYMDFIVWILSIGGLFHFRKEERTVIIVLCFSQGHDKFRAMGRHMKRAGLNCWVQGTATEKTEHSEQWRGKQKSNQSEFWKKPDAIQFSRVQQTLSRKSLL